MRTYTLSMPDTDNLLSLFDDPKNGPPEVSVPAGKSQAAAPVTNATKLPEGEREGGTERLSRLRTHLHTFLKADDKTRMKHMNSLRQAVQEFARRVEIAGQFPLRRVVTAIESLIQEIGKKPEKAGATAPRTLAHSIDFLANLVAHAGRLDWKMADNLNVLAVDDEVVSRRAIIKAFRGAGIGCVSVGDPALALPILAESQFDLVVFDIDMPGMDGHELCRRLRLMPGYAKVPVFFVTALTDFQTRVASLSSGGDDFIGKPFLCHELAVKAMVSILEQRFGLASRSPSQRPEAAVAKLPSRT